MADYEHVDLVLGDSLWDAEGREFTTKHTRWASAKQAGAMARRNDAVGLVEAPGQPISWMRGVELAQWWAHAKRHFDVPGTVDGKPDEQVGSGARMSGDEATSVCSSSSRTVDAAWFETCLGTPALSAA